jgi:protein-tyrosine phosphatase
MSILFICTGNWYRSRFAESYLKSKGYKHVLSRGVNVNNNKKRKYREIHKQSSLVKNKLKELGLEKYINNKTPKQLTENDMLKSNKIILINKKEHYSYIIKKYPKYKNKLIVWNIRDCCWNERNKSNKILTKIMSDIDELFVK